MTQRYGIVVDGTVVNIALGDYPLEPNWIQHDTVEIGWTYDGTNLIPSPPKPIPPPPQVLNNMAFVARFTSDEYVGIVTAAKSDPSVEAWYNLLFLAGGIDLEDQRTIDGVNFMVTKNLLTAERANEILTTPVLPNEK